MGLSLKSLCYRKAEWRIGLQQDSLASPCTIFTLGTSISNFVTKQRWLGCEQGSYRAEGEWVPFEGRWNAAVGGMPLLTESHNP